MRYKKGDTVTLNADYDISGGRKIPAGTSGIIKRVLSLVKGYLVNFKNFSDVHVHESFLR